MKTLFYLLSMSLYALAAPQPPYSLTLNPNSIQPIPIHAEIDTLLIFPSDVEAILGNRLTTGEPVSGSVLYQQGELKPTHIILRHLDSTSIVLMTIVIGDKAFVFRVEASETPASVIYFKDTEPQSVPKASVIDPADALAKERPISNERKNEILRLVRESKKLQEKIPQEYEGFSEKQVFLTSSESELETRILRVAKFKAEDALIFSGTISNYSSKPVQLQNHLGSLKVGQDRQYSPSILRANNQVLDPNQRTTFEGLLIGNGKGQKLHLSLDNEFSLHLSKTK